MTTEQPGASPALSDQLGLVSEREHFEAWCRNWGVMSPHHAAVAWDAWQAVAAMRDRRLTDEQAAEFGALCVMNRRTNKTAREFLAEYKAERGIGA